MATEVTKNIRHVVNKAFRRGQKEVYLPSAVVTLSRMPRPMPPEFAHFQVPLRFNKLDLKDYLRHAYGIAALSVRSHIVQRSVTRHPITRRIFRPASLKFMTVEMTQPFMWPASPKKGDEVFDSAADRHQENIRQQQNRLRRLMENQGIQPQPADLPITEERKLLRTQAKDLLEGTTKWDNKRELDPRWTGSRIGHMD